MNQFIIALLITGISLPSGAYNFSFDDNNRQEEAHINLREIESNNIINWHRQEENKRDMEELKEELEDIKDMLDELND